MCGIIGVSGTADAARDVFVGLMNLQHRGQDGAGILTLAESGSELFNLQKGSGLIENVFSERSFKRGLKGRTALGHTRYATIGRQDPNLLQPFFDARSTIGIGHNGNIVNVYTLRDELVAEGLEFTPATESDSEVILKLLAFHLDGCEPTAEHMFKSIEASMHRLVGSYAVIGIDGSGGLFGFRDPDGIRPLVFGSRVNSEQKTVYALASESIALTYLGYEIEGEIGPGEAIYINGSEYKRKVLFKRSISPCMFESVYFSRVESQLEDHSIYETRFQLGLVLAEHIKELGIVADVVVPVPETSRSAAIAIAEALDLPFRESLIKNRYVNRTFILDNHQARQEAIRRKLSPITSEIKGKRCLVVDDSIVRGTTAAQIIELMRQSGAKEVIMASTCPQIRYPCYYGIDFPSQDELVAYDCTDDEIARKLGADRVVFQTIDGLRKALSKDGLCTGCLSGIYPTDIASGDDFQSQRKKDRTTLIRKS
jgi:amidophosphoribosyltransferase